MSGGSFDYLYNADLIQHRAYVQRMAETLRDLGAEDAAQATEEIVRLMGAIEQAQSKLADVWHGVEWWVSSDIGREEALEAITEWRTKREREIREAAEAMHAIAANVRPLCNTVCCDHLPPFQRVPPTLDAPHFLLCDLPKDHPKPTMGNHECPACRSLDTKLETP